MPLLDIQDYYIMLYYIVYVNHLSDSEILGAEPRGICG